MLGICSLIFTLIVLLFNVYSFWPRKTPETIIEQLQWLKRFDRENTAIGIIMVAGPIVLLAAALYEHYYK